MGHVELEPVRELAVEEPRLVAEELAPAVGASDPEVHLLTYSSVCSRDPEWPSTPSF